MSSVQANLLPLVIVVTVMVVLRLLEIRKRRRQREAFEREQKAARLDDWNSPPGR